jgi:YVTN family beta-propeller protein
MNPGGITASSATSPVSFGPVTDGVIYTFTATVTNSVGTSPVSPASHTVRSFPPGPPPSPLVYVPSLDQDDVYVIDTRDNVVINRIPVGAVPTGVAVSPTGTRAFVAASLDDTVYVINTSTLGVIATVPVGINPTGIAVNPAGTRVYVANSDSDTVSVIDATNNTVVATVPMATQPRGIVVSADGTRVYVAVGLRVRAIDTATNTVVTSGTAIGLPAGIDVHPDGTHLYVTNLANLRVNQVNTSNLQSQANTGDTPAQVGAGIAIAPNGTIYAARNSTDEIAVINPATVTVTTTIPVGTAPRGVAITPNGTHMYVTNEGSDNVSVIRLSDNAVVATIPVGPFPGGLARFIGPPGKPEAPTGVSAVAGVASATVSFSPPPYDGGSPVTSYTVTSSIGGFVAGGSSSPITISGLAHGQTYTFTVTATNVSGTGAASAPSNAVTTPSAPLPPSIDSVIPGNGSVSVAFSPPGSDGGTPITGYTAQCNEIGGSGTASASGAGSPIVVSGLVNGVSYTCTVRANNAVGASQPSDVSDTVVPQMLPGAPTIGLATAGNASASVAFTPPANDGGQPIFVYTATANPGGVTATGAASPIVVGGLTNGTAYTFTVTATTATGTGLPSAASNSVVPSTVPGAPTIGTATAGDGQASVSFTAAASNGSPISSYTVTSSPGGITVASAGSPIVVTGLTNGTAYTFTVFANNANGSGPPSAASNSVTPQVGAFTLTVAKAGTGTGTVTSSPTGIDCGATCSFGFANGAAVTLTPTAGAGSVFAGWSGACSGTGACIVTMDAAKSVTASFDSPPRLVNISTRAQVGTGDNVLIGGLIVGGPVNKTLVIRARGPSLVPTGIVNPLLNPKLDLYSGQTVIASSDDWGDNANAAAITASGFAPPQAAESAILINLAPGPYTAIVSGVGGTTGVGLVEVFEVDHPEVPLINIATRGRVQTGNDVMIAGFIIQGVGQQTVVVRARGPSLAATGVPGVLANPTLTLVRSSDGVIIASNDDWGTAANAAALQASGFAPADPQEAAILITLDPGAYTAVVSGVGSTTGVAIVEVFRN